MTDFWNGRFKVFMVNMGHIMAVDRLSSSSTGTMWQSWYLAQCIFSIFSGETCAAMSNSQVQFLSVRLADCLDGERDRT